jgi:hypothetical protein
LEGVIKNISPSPGIIILKESRRVYKSGVPDIQLGTGNTICTTVGKRGSVIPEHPTAGGLSLARKGSKETEERCNLEDFH